MTMNKPITRRGFLRTQVTLALAAGAFPSIIPASALGREGKVAPGSRIVVGCIGNGPQGRGVMNGFLSQADAQVVAVCDVKRDQLELARAAVNARYQNSDCARYGDSRELLARKDIDAVLIATPDHWHVPAAVAAARAGKDIYLEKPMGLSLAEDRMLRRVVQKHKRVFQFGTQQRSAREFWRACQLVRNGRIGKLKHINVWAPASQPGGSTTPVPVPDNLNYDRWLGPARFTPYTADKCLAEGKTWWFNSDYALGFIAGWGVHPLDIALWGHPKMFHGRMSIEGKAIFPQEGACNTSVAWKVDFTFADGVTMDFRGSPNGYQEVNPLNDFTPWREKYGEVKEHGTAFEGTEGWVLVKRNSLRASPETLAEESMESFKIQLPRSGNHVRNFLDCVRSRARTVCPIEEAVQADTLCQVSDIATRLDRKLTFDPQAEKFAGDNEANRKLQLRPMRAPYNEWL
jgi:glucose-fructose oxidoreductase